VVAVTADHGESFGKHGVWYGHAGLYPDSVHVPLILSWPGAPAGRRVSVPVSQLDLAATLLELSGVAGHDLPGQSFASLAVDQGTALETPRFALSAHRFSASVTSESRHLILHLTPQHQRNMTSSFARHQVELYDLDADPDCVEDLSVAQHAETARLRARLITWLEAAEDKGWVGQELDDPERLEQLRQLGYLEVADAGHTTLWTPDDCDHCAAFAKDDP
jgi:arylsulfatase A-like enzyme